MWWRRLAAPTARTWRAPVRVSAPALQLKVAHGSRRVVLGSFFFLFFVDVLFLP